MTDEQKRAEYKKEWYRKKLEAAPEEVRAANRANSRRYAERHPTKAAEYSKRWREKQTPEALAERNRKYYEKHAEARRAYSREYAERNKERRKALALARELANPGHARRLQRERRRRNLSHTLLKAAQKNAKDKGVPFDLELSDIVIPAVCPVFGFELKPGEKRFCDTSPSIDRIVPAKGYTKGNIVIVSWKANRLKNNATADDLLRLWQFYRQFPQE